MARRKKRSASPDPLAEVPGRVLKHIDALGFRAIDEYTGWCAERGFAATTDKHWRSLVAEKQAHDEEQRQRSERARLARNPRRVVEAVCRGELTAAEVTSSRIPPFELRTGTKGKDLRIWRIRELLSSQALIAEGRAMRHCVGSYASSCANGHCSIWTMEVESFDGLEKRQTIEVNAHRAVVQSRGKRNDLPTQQEREMLGRWAQEAELTISSYVDQAW